MKRHLSIFLLVFIFCFLTFKNQKIKNQHKNINTDSSLYYFNLFTEKFGGINEYDMDSVVDYYNFLIVNLEDSINKYKSTKKDLNSYKFETELHQDYIQKHQEAKQILYRYKCCKLKSDSLLILN